MDLLVGKRIQQFFRHQGPVLRFHLFDILLPDPGDPVVDIRA